MTKLFINTDGASRGNPGNAAASFIIRDENRAILFQEGKTLGIATNNEAEYSAVQLALEKLLSDFTDLLPARAEIYADSRLIVEQLSGNFKVKNNRMKSMFFRVRELEKEIGEVYYTYIPREENQQADRLANMALDESL